jgi:intracellular sulfur oxidation DsrE/DsrF family protein
MVLFLAIVACLPVRAVAGNVGGNKAWTSTNGGAFPYYNRAHPLKVVFEVPLDPKKWPSVALVLTHNIVSIMGHGVPMEAVLVAPGPTIHFFMKKFNPNGYKALKRLHALGLKMVACHAALVAFHVSRKELFPFVGVAYNSGVVYILKKEAQGYSYYTWP